MKKINKIKRIFYSLLIGMAICLAASLPAYANEAAVVIGDAAEDENSLESGENSLKNGENELIEGNIGDENGATADTGEATEDGDNLFAEIYSLAEENADKIFSALAFIGTLIVSVTYKSGLLPLLSDALSKFKSVIEAIKAENAEFERKTDGKISDIGRDVEEILDAVAETDEKIAAMESSLASYEESANERAKLKIILEGQIDMLYSIFMSSSLPQFEKEEIGERILKMREELNSYESGK